MSQKPKLELKIRQPAPPSLKAIENPLVIGNHSMLIYCPQAKTGALYLIDTGMWHCFHPCDTLDDFKRLLVAQFPEALETKH
jgi:hypothetical protein